MSLEVRSPRATCSGLTNNKLDQVVITLTVNSISTANLSTNPNVNAKDKSVNVLANDVVQELKTFQNKKFSKSSQDITVNIYDGAQHTFVWQGLINGPAYSSSANHVRFGINAISKIAKLDQLKTDIYFKLQPAKTFSKEFTGSVPVRLRDELKNLIEGWTAAIEQNTQLGALDKQILLAQHAKNQEVLPIWYDILDHSDDNADFIDNSQSQINTSISRYIKDIYQQPTNNFFTTMLQFCNDFKLTYLPPHNSDTEYGKLRGTSNLFATPVSKKINIIGLSSDVGNLFVPPINSVWVSGEGSIVKKTGLLEPGIKLFAAYPAGSDTEYTACTQRIPPPPWLNELMPIKTAAVKNAEKPTLDPKPQTIFFDSVGKATTDIAKIKLKILTKWAQLWFQDLAYANETVTLITPLDLDWEIGKYYNVENGENKLFTALASNVRHTLTIQDANTMIQFSHVKY